MARFIRGLLPEDVIAGVEQVSKYDALLRPYVGDRYTPDSAKDALEDEALSKALFHVADAVKSIGERHPFIVRLTPPSWMLMPWRSVLDREVRHRVTRSVRMLRELMASIRWEHQTVDRNFQVVPVAPVASATAFIYDERVPTEIARRLLSAMRSRVTMDLIQIARRNHAWPHADFNRALMDWSDMFEDAMGLLASAPGAHVPSLPQSKRIDYREIAMRQEQRRNRIAADVTRAVEESRK